MKKYTFIFISVLSTLLFSNCESKNSYILDIQFERDENSPGPDLITFIITSNEQLFKEHVRDFEKFEEVEVCFNNRKKFKSSLFSVKEIKNDSYELKISSPYFSIIDYFEKDEIYKLFKQSDDLQIIIKSKDNIFFNFTKCIVGKKDKD